MQGEGWQCASSFLGGPRRRRDHCCLCCRSTSLITDALQCCMPQAEPQATTILCQLTVLPSSKLHSQCTKAPLCTHCCFQAGWQNLTPCTAFPHLLGMGTGAPMGTWLLGCAVPPALLYPTGAGPGAAGPLGSDERHDQTQGPNLDLCSYFKSKNKLDKATGTFP